MLDSEEEEEELLSALCPYCNTRAPIYTCPRCFARTCSVTCCKKHKLFRQCNGVRDPAAYVKRSKLMTEEGVNRDYSFLTSLERQIAKPVELAKEDDEEDGDDDGTEKSGGDRRQMKDRIEQMLAPRKTIVKWAPWDGFLRAKQNRTRVVRPSKKKPAFIEWTVEWMLLDTASGDDDGPRRILDHPVPENSEVAFSFFYPTISDETRKQPKKVKSQTQFYLVLQAPADRKKCIRLDPEGRWSDNLRERTVLEFPQVLVTTDQLGEALKGWEIVKDERKIVELPQEDIGGKGTARKKESGEGGGKSEAKGKALDSKAKGCGAGRGTIVVPDSSAVESGTVLRKASPTVSKELADAPILEKRKLLDDDILNTVVATKRARQS